MPNTPAEWRLDGFEMPLRNKLIWLYDNLNNTKTELEEIKKDAFINPGDTLTFPGTGAYGYITRSVTSLRLYIPLPARPTSRDVTIISLIGWIGGVQGNIDASDGETEWVGKEGVSVESYITTNGLLRVTISKTTGFKDPDGVNTRANTPVFMNVSSIEINFAGGQQEVER